ncbi:MAG: hypothetical protein Kow0075_12250 [Salibacteraceae bacterium]
MTKARWFALVFMLVLMAYATTLFQKMRFDLATSLGIVVISISVFWVLALIFYRSMKIRKAFWVGTLPSILILLLLIMMQHIMLYEPKVDVHLSKGHYKKQYVFMTWNQTSKTIHLKKGVGYIDSNKMFGHEIRIWRNGREVTDSFTVNRIDFHKKNIDSMRISYVGCFEIAPKTDKKHKRFHGWKIADSLLKHKIVNKDSIKVRTYDLLKNKYVHPTLNP